MKVAKNPVRSSAFFTGLTVPATDSMMPMMARSFPRLLFCCLLLLICISLHDNHRDNVAAGGTLDVVESGEDGGSLQWSFSKSLSTVVDATFTNANDTTAMLAFRESFNNFTGSNWYSSDDPCAPSPGE
jgi:hypothetical protein